VQDPPLANAPPPDPDSPRDPNSTPDVVPGPDPTASPRDPDLSLDASWSHQLDPSRRDLNLMPDRAPGAPEASTMGRPARGDRSTDARPPTDPARSPDANPTVEVNREADTTRPTDADRPAGTTGPMDADRRVDGTGPEDDHGRTDAATPVDDDRRAEDTSPLGADRRVEGDRASRIGVRPIDGATAGGPGARWGEPGYRPPPDANRPTRVAAAWIIGGIGAVLLALVAVVGLGVILLAAGQRHDNSTGAAPAPVAPFSTQTSPTTADPNAPTTAPGSAPPTSAGGSRSRNTDYSIRLPDGYQDVTESWQSEHPADHNAVQVLAGAPGSPATTRSTIVISQLPRGAAQGGSVNRLMADRLRTLRSGGARGSGPPRNTSIGPDPAVEADLTQRVAGELTHRTEVLTIHRGRVWDIAITSPDGTETLAAQAWLTVKNGWQWQ
jgi:hypothetical protein